MVNRVYGLIVIIVTLGALFFVYRFIMHHDVETIRYVALGDSYTIGSSVSEHEAWPALLADHLQKDGVPVDLVMNPARIRFTTQDVIDKELLYVDSEHANFVTLLIGVNDLVQGVDAGTFRKRFGFIVDELLKRLPKERVVVVTIPDFSLTPQGLFYGDPVQIENELREFNNIIIEESGKREVVVVDIFELSRRVKDDPSLVAVDGLHPSGKQYRLWEERIFPVVYKNLQQ